MTSYEKRILKELCELRSDTASGLTVFEDEWPERLIVGFETDPESVYHGKKYKLEITFKTGYPFVAPMVKFILPDVPLHPHIFSNGHICLSILFHDWRPVMSLTSVCLSIVSMVNKNKKLCRPPDDSTYVSNPRSSYFKNYGMFYSILTFDIR